MSAADWKPERAATAEQLRADIDHGLTGDKVPCFDPAAAPFGTDEEAAGTPTPGWAIYIERQMFAERRRRLKLERERRPAPADPAELVADEMWDALATLSERQRTAIVLRFYEDLPDQRIAEIIGCRPATVRTAIHRGLRELRKVIDR